MPQDMDSQCLFPKVQLGSAQREASQAIDSSEKLFMSKLFQQLVWWGVHQQQVKLCGIHYV